MLRTFDLKVADATLAGYQQSAPGVARGTVVITHGYAEHAGRYQELADFLCNDGWNVVAYDVRGHGHSPGARGYVRRFSNYLDDLAAACAYARATNTGALVVLGHSNGGLITLAAVVRGLQVDAMILTSPFLRLALPVTGAKRLAARLAGRLWPRLSLANGMKISQLTSDPGKQAARAADTLCFDTANARWFIETLAMQDWVHRHAPERRLPPSFWLLAGHDEIADARAAAKLATRLPQSEVVTLEGEQHEVLNELHREQSFRRIVDFLARNTA